MSFAGLESRIIPVMPVRVWRTYTGGLELEKWLGQSDPRDGDHPEEWVASTVVARNPNPNIVDEGLSKIRLEGGSEITLAKLIESNPAAFLGKKHFKKYSANMGVLVKIIDSLGRLTIQVHPDKAFAKSVFQSDYGKTETWFILGGRKVAGEDPYILLGFKPGISREKWEKLFWTQDIPAMIEGMHKIYVKPGEVYYIPGGVPHAIGSGCFLVEIQEPTDLTIRVERKTPEGLELPEFLLHQGKGFNVIFDCFHYDGCSLEKTLAQWRVNPRLVSQTGGGSETVLLGSDITNLFGLWKLDVKNRLQTGLEKSFSVVIVVSGQGKACFNGGELEIKAADLLFIPAAVGSITWTVSNNSSLQLLRCFPPV